MRRRFWASSWRIRLWIGYFRAGWLERGELVKGGKGGREEAGCVYKGHMGTGGIQWRGAIVNALGEGFVDRLPAYIDLDVSRHTL